MADLALNKLDAKILSMADHASPEEISLKLGGTISAAGIAARAKQLLTSRDWLTAAEQDELVTYKMRRILGELETKYLDYDGAKVQLSLLRAIGERLDNRRAATAVDLSTYTENVGRQLGHVVDLALSYMKGALREEVDPTKWDALVDEAMGLAQQEIEKKQIESGQ